MLRILLVDDHVLFREGLVSLLGGQPDMQVVGQAGSVAEAIRLAGELKPDLILMDFSLPDGNGLEATQAILATQPETKIVFLTVHIEDERLFAAINCGAKGYLLKNVPIVDLLRFLRGVKEGKAALSRAMTSRLMEEFSRLQALGASGGVEPEALLTSREVEILQVMATGATNDEIAERLVISSNTVKNHIHNILAKLNLNNRRQAVNFAQRHGLIRPSFVYQRIDQFTSK